MAEHPNAGDLIDWIDMARCLTCSDLIVKDGKWIKAGRLCECCGYPVCRDCEARPGPGFTFCEACGAPIIEGEKHVHDNG